MKAITAYDLNAILEKRFGKRLDTDIKSILYGKIIGTFDSKRFSITFDSSEYLTFTTFFNDENILTELLPVLKEAVGNIEPICSYYMLSKDAEPKKKMFTLEWDFKKPNERISDIVNDRAFSSKTKVFGIKLYNSKTIEDYLEEKESFERIYGIYPGSIENVEKINNLNELDLYLSIDYLKYYIWKTSNDISLNKIPNIDLTDEQYALEYMMYQTIKFGVKLDSPKPGNHIIKTPSYNAWYNFYKIHFTKVLTKEQWKKFLYAKRNNLDISSFLPKGNWKDLIKKKKQKVLK